MQTDHSFTVKSVKLQLSQKTCHCTFIHNLDKYQMIFKILSLSYCLWNLQQYRETAPVTYRRLKIAKLSLIAFLTVTLDYFAHRINNTLSICITVVRLSAQNVLSDIRRRLSHLSITSLMTLCLKTCQTSIDLFSSSMSWTFAWYIKRTFMTSMN